MFVPRNKNIWKCLGGCYITVEDDVSFHPTGPLHPDRHIILSNEAWY